MAGIRLEWAQFGDFDSFDVIRSDASMADIADEDLPSPIATSLKSMFYLDNAVVEGSVYYYKVRAWRGVEALVSGELMTVASLNPEITGGAVQDITILGQLYRVHTFTTNSIVNVTKAGLVDVVIVGGGGGAGVNAVGGAGGGGVIQQSVRVAIGQSNVIVGAGGHGTNNGSNSSVFDLVAFGGGHTKANTNGAVGGSGGAGSASTRADYLGGDGTPGQGYGGGRAFGNTGVSGRRGGGGAGAPGANAASGVAGNGGDGLLVTIRGVDEYFGGGGGAANGGIGGIGGGGGGDANGASNTGGGSGGYGNGPGSGGSGIVIIRYRI